MPPFQVATAPRMNTRPVLQLKDLDHSQFHFAIGTFMLEAQVMVQQSGNYRDWVLGYIQLVSQPGSIHYYIVDPGSPGGGVPSVPHQNGAILVAQTAFPPGLIRDAPTPFSYSAHPFADESWMLYVPDREMRAGERLHLPQFSDTPGASGASHPRAGAPYPCFIDGFIKRATFHTFVVAFHRTTQQVHPLYVVKWILECERHGLAFEGIRREYRRWLGNTAARLRFPGRPWFRLAIADHHVYRSSDPSILPQHVIQSPPVMRSIDTELNRQFSWTWTAPTRWTGVQWRAS